MGIERASLRDLYKGSFKGLGFKGRVTIIGIYSKSNPLTRAQVGLSCSCWDESKVGGQWMILDLGSRVSVPGLWSTIL